jgi:hypothetical protein
MAVLGDARNIIVGAAQVFVANGGPLEYYSGTGANAEYRFSGGGASGIPAFSASARYADTLASASATWTNVGYTMNGLEVQFQPDFGEVQVDQLLDVARMYKQGMQVNLVTAFAEATLENLLIATAAGVGDLDTTNANRSAFNMQSGNLGEVPLERALIAVGPGTGDPAATGNAAIERVYAALRVLSIESVTVSAKRDEASMFEVTFRLMPASNGSYGKIVDRVVAYSGAV